MWKQRILVIFQTALSDFFETPIFNNAELNFYSNQKKKKKLS